MGDQSDLCCCKPAAWQENSPHPKNCTPCLPNCIAAHKCFLGAKHHPQRTNNTLNIILATHTHTHTRTRTLTQAQSRTLYFHRRCVACPVAGHLSRGPCSSSLAGGRASSSTSCLAFVRHSVKAQVGGAAWPALRSGEEQVFALRVQRKETASALHCVGIQHPHIGNLFQDPLIHRQLQKWGPIHTFLRDTGFRQTLRYVVCWGKQNLQPVLRSPWVKKRRLHQRQGHGHERASARQGLVHKHTSQLIRLAKVVRSGPSCSS